MSRLGRRVPNRPHLYGPVSYTAQPVGTIAVALPPVTMVMTGIAYPTGTIAKTLPPVTMVMTGTHNATSPKVQGTIWTKTLTGAGGSETFTASAVDEAALAYVVLHGANAVDVFASITGSTDIADSPSVTTTTADDMVIWAHFRDAHVITVLPGTGTNVGPQASSANAVRASVAANLQTQTAVGASGTRRFAGAASDAWAAATIAVTGIPANLITGTIAVALPPVTMVAAGTFQQNVTGTIAVSLGPVTMTASGTVALLAPTPTLRGALTSYPRLRKGFSAPRLD